MIYECWYGFPCKFADRLSGRASADADFDALEDDEDVLGGDAGEELPDYLK